MDRSLRLLVTGFGPFPGIPSNPSAEAARRVAGSRRWAALGIATKAVVLPTTYAALQTDLKPAIAAFDPDALLMIGVAGRSREVRIESRGANRTSILLPDAVKVRPSRLAMAEHPSHRLTRAGPARQLAVVRRHGFRARVSRDAGTYLCNASYFAALEERIPVLFVHIPKPGRAMRRRPGKKRRATWHESLSAALSDVALDLARQARWVASRKRN
jgi:pyroglutamyl-peptidase